MEFGWTAAQEELYERGLSLSRERLEPLLSARGEASGFSREAWRLCGELGFLGACVPERYGGLGLDALSTARLIEAFGRGCEDHGLVFSACAHLFACVMPILECADEETRNALLPKLCSGEWVGANAITESEAGSDVHAIKTRAVRSEPDYLLSGDKSYVTNGPEADLFLVYASTNPAHGFMGLSAFLVEKGTEGLVVGKPFSKMGLNGSPICSIYLEDVKVPEARRLGAEGKGADVFRSSMLWERACLFASYVGLMDRLLDQTVSFAKERRQFRKPISKNQAISHRIADMKLRLDSARLLLYRACWLMDRGEDALMEVSMAKVAISEAAVQAGIDAIQIHGGLGYMRETGIEAALRAAIPGTIFSGTSEIQRNIIAGRLGL